MSNPCECCQSKRRFIRQINGNFTHSMVMPDWLVNYFGGKISGTIKLEAPNGCTYDVRVTENMNRTILKSGWTAFVDANQIKDNYYLMFQYLGNARFQVTIFDSNGTEKALSCAGKETASDFKKPSRHDVHNSSSSRDGTTQLLAGRGSDSDGCPEESSCRYCKLAKTPGLSYTSEEFSEENNPSLDDSAESDDRQMFSDNYFLSGPCNLTEAEEFEIHALVEKIRPELPVLVVVIKNINVIHPCRLEIPKDYALKYFPCEDTNITLQLPRKNKNWKCKFRVSGVVRRNLSFGEFVRDNNVKEGDICLFQPMTNVKKRRFIMIAHLLHKASIDHSPGRRTGIGSNNGSTSRKISAGAKEEPPSDGEDYYSEHEDHEVSDDSKGCSEPPFMLADRACLTPAQEKKVLEKVEEIEPDLPIYVSIINKSNVYVAIMNKSNVHQPGSHITPVLNFSSQYVARYFGERFAAGRRRRKISVSVTRLVLQLQGKSRSWSTELCHRIRDTCVEFWVQKGWPSFTRDNRLRKGDLCLFKLMDNKEPLKMMVCIIRREEC